MMVTITLLPPIVVTAFRRDANGPISPSVGQAVDAVGVLALMCAQYERQLAETDGTEFFADFVQLDAKRPIEQALVKKQEQLRAAFVVAGKWGLIPLEDTLSADAIMAAAAAVEAMGELPIAVPVDPNTGKSRPTMQTVLEKMALGGGGDTLKIKGSQTGAPTETENSRIYKRMSQNPYLT